MRRAKAFCPGHVTGFFEICRADTLLATGSRGAGLCLSLGATSEVRIEDSKSQTINVEINGIPGRGEVTKEAIRYMLGKDKMKLEVSTVLDLPQSQGFGMSAAGALSAAVAAASLIGKDRQKAFEAAHVAEITCGSGLGDVSALHKGGITIRKKPGLPPIGEVLRIDGTPKVVLCVVGRRMLTKTVLSDPVKSMIVNRIGGQRVDQIVKEPKLSVLMSLSRSFAVESGLASLKTAKTMAVASEHGSASMSMLGNSVFAVGDIKNLKDTLTNYGAVFVCKVDDKGPRIL